MIYLPSAEILMLHYADVFTDTDNSFQNFWSYRYNISCPDTLLSALKQAGYIAVGDIDYQLQRLSVANIKKLLSENGLKTTGKKADLINRLIASADITAIYNSLPHYYCITDKGISATQDPEFAYILYAHRNQFLDDYGLNIVTIRNLMNGKQPETYKREIIDYLLKQSTPPYYYVAEIYSEIEDYSKSFYYYVVDLRYYLCGQTLQFHDPMTAPVIAAGIAKSAFPYETSLLRIPFGRLRPLRDVIYKLNYSNEQVQQKIAAIVDQLAASQFFFTDSECVQIIYHELCNDTNTLTAIYQTAEQRYKAKYSLR